jgi:hypothetical protein
MISQWGYRVFAVMGLRAALLAASYTGAFAQDQPKDAASQPAPAAAAEKAEKTVDAAPTKRAPSKAVTAAVRNTMASPVRAKCAGQAQADVDKKAVTSVTVPFRASAGGIIGAVIGTVIVSAIEHERRKGIYSEAETKCLAAAGLAPMGRAAPAATGEGRVRNASTGAKAGSSGNATKCACRQMTACSGSWLNMSCSQLKATCRDARTTKPLVWVRNSCEKLEALVGSL